MIEPFTELFTCRVCGGVRGREVKPKWAYCAGAGAGSKGQDCELGAAEHLHVECLGCGFQWGMETRNAEPALRDDELRDLRDLLRQARVASQS